MRQKFSLKNNRYWSLTITFMIKTSIVRIGVCQDRSNNKSTKTSFYQGFKKCKVKLMSTLLLKLQDLPVRRDLKLFKILMYTWNGTTLVSTNSPKWIIMFKVNLIFWKCIANTGPKDKPVKKWQETRQWLSTLVVSD